MEELMQLLRNRVPAGSALNAGTPLLSSGLIDSFSLADLIAAFEKHFGVSVEPADVGADNFDTPVQMFDFIRARQ